MSQQNDWLNTIQSTLKSLFTNKNFNIYHTLQFSALPIILFVSATFGLKTWLNVEVILSFVFGIALMIEPSAKYLLQYQMKGPVDNYHLFLSSLLGAYLIYSAMFPVYLKRSRDESIFVSHFWSKIISSNLIFVTMVFSYLDGIRWNYYLLCFSGGAVLATLIINGYFLMNSSNIRAQNHNRLPANIVAKFEFFMLLSAGLILFAYPDHAMLELRAPNDSHRLLCRVCGAILFSLSIESFTMPSFLFESDKQKFLMARLVGSLGELVVILLGWYYFKVIRNYQSLGIFLFINISYNLLIIYGYLSCRSKVLELRQRAEGNYNSSSANTSLNASIGEKKSS